MRGRRGYYRQAFNAETVTIRDPEAPATKQQLNFLRALGRDRDIEMTAADFDTMLDVWIESGICTKGFVSAQIEEMKTKAPKPRRQAGPGYYEYEGDLYVVVLNKAKTHSYAKKLINTGSEDNAHWTWSFDAAKGVATRLAGASPLTEAEAAKWGHLHGRCVVCLKPLTDPESVKRGFGPVCAKALKR